MWEECLHLLTFKNFVFNFLNFIIIICTHAWMSEDNFVVSVVLYLYMGFGDQIQAIRLGQ